MPALRWLAYAAAAYGLSQALSVPVTCQEGDGAMGRVVTHSIAAFLGAARASDRIADSLPAEWTGPKAVVFVGGRLVGAAGFLYAGVAGGIYEALGAPYSPSSYPAGL